MRPPNERQHVPLQVRQRMTGEVSPVPMRASRCIKERAPDDITPDRLRRFWLGVTVPEAETARW